MRRWHWMTTLILATLTVCGCIPRRLFWSPDGQYAAIIAEDGLRMCDTSGKLSEVVAQDVRMAAWFPDSRRLVATRTTKAANWTEIQAFLSPEQREALPRLADPLREEILAHIGEWDKFKPKVAATISDGEFAALLLYVRDQRNEGLPEKFGDQWKDIATMAIDTHLLEMYEANGLKVTPGQVLHRTVDAIDELRVSPDGKIIACVQKISTHGNSILYRLSVISAAGGEWRTLAEPVALFPDWSTDSRSLVYATTRTRPAEGSDSLQFGAVVLQRVRDEPGEILEAFAAPEELLGLVFGPQTKIRCLPDGRIIFSAREITLPATSKDIPRYASLFSVDLGRQPTVNRLVPRDAEVVLPGGLANGYFELSPDSTRIAVSNDVTSEGNQTTVSILNLLTGEVQSVIAQQGRLKSIPAWRTARELSLIVPEKSAWGSAEKYELVLWEGPDQVRCISREWPDIFKQKNADSHPDQ
ncbi:MAG: hypothetical protein GXY44_01815 [Phycisphaerales bacterium]|nr:hypothetical protein [Phycisphaerales bacterium]